MTSFAPPPNMLLASLPDAPPETRAEAVVFPAEPSYASFALWQRLTVAVDSPQVWAVSFDCFDTLLFRDVPRPVDLFPRIGARLQAAGLLPSWLSPSRFAGVRIAAEAEARVRQHARTGAHEVSLSDIYAAFPKELLPFDRHEEAVAAELAVEREALRPFPMLAELARRVRARGKTVVVTSDTYFQPDWLRDTLAEILGLTPDLLVCSSAYGKSKSEGLLAILPDQLGLRPEEIVHIGDNYEADVVASQRAGLLGLHVCHGTSELWQTFEQEHRCAQLDPGEGIDLEHGDLGLQSVRAKCAAIAVETPLAGFWQFGATVLGPAMTLFGEWLAARVRAFEADALLCVMREGPFLGRLARAELAEAGIPLVDVWLSRRVLRYASVVQLDQETLRGLCQQLHSPTLRQVCDDLGVAPDELPADLGCTPADTLDHHRLETVLRRIVDSPALTRAILARAAQMRQAVVAHLFRQLGEAGAGPRRTLRLALVDAGWNGQIQRMLGRILAAENVAVELAGFYVGTAQATSGTAAIAQRMEGFLFDFGRPAWATRHLMRSVEILEQCLSCESGSTITLSGAGTPLVAPDLIPRAQRGQIRQVQNGILFFQSLWQGSGGHAADPAAPWLTALVRRHLFRALTQPSEAEAAMFAAWSHDDNLLDDRSDTILPDRVRSHARHMSVRQILITPSTEAYWNYGLAAQTSPQARALARAAMDGLADAADFERPFGKLSTLYWSWDGGYHEEASSRTALVANHEGRTYVQLSTARLKDGNLRFLRFEPLNTPACVVIDFLELTIHFAAPCPSVRITLRETELLACARSGFWPAGGGCFITTASPQIHIDLRALGGWQAAAVDLHAGLQVTPLPATDADRVSLLPPDALSAFPPAALARKPLSAGLGSVDAVRGVEGTAGGGDIEVACGSSRILTVAGWTTGQEGGLCRRAAYLMLRRQDGLSYFVPASRTHRKDVATALHNHDALFAGVEASFSPAPLPPGPYALIWVQVNDGAGTLAETGATLHVR